MELLGHVLMGLLQLVGEALLELLGEALLDAVFRGLNSLLSSVLTEVTIVPIVFFFFGLILGGASMGFLGARLREHDRKVIQLESFGGGFALALGIAIIRFFYAR